MPFANKDYRPFTRANIESLNLNQIGVYGIYNKDKWIYVGRGDIRDNMLRHVDGDKPCIQRHNPTHWVAELTGDAVTREKQLISELAPACNQRIG